ncbi:hypothetical protein BOTBODRAFT_177956 [Botryobasidium botryosum FD-172 SS1]|uniref:F-box domain-containing protein n=1 Tax=Botryobasidium botryosum (strain FD-172 SS1) TaxID=930990 RepID=A0A067M522_BOTB1|nr:hypothetical protein BOTBODRAFT_177956 [Botryobasidium botryosum FD-172 SS1]
MPSIAQAPSSAIYRLPVEILVIIFEDALEEYNSHSHFGSSHVHTRAPLNLMRVSKAWRDVAQGAPELWRQIDPAVAQFVPTFLACSKGRSLDIIWFPHSVYLSYPCLVSRANTGSMMDLKYFERIYYFVQSLERLENRWRVLDFTVHLEYEPILDTFFALPAPHLETLRLTVERAIGEEDADSRSIFTSYAPLLQEVQLTGICISLSSPILCGLSQLHLECIHFIQSTVFQLIHVLSACPALSELSLSSLLFSSLGPEGASSPSPSLWRVSLPCLKEVYYHRLHQRLVRFLFASIIVPSTARLTIDLRHVTIADIFPAHINLEQNLFNIHRVRALTVVSCNDGWGGTDYCEVFGRDEKRGAELMSLRFEVRQGLLDTVHMSLPSLQLPHVTSLYIGVFPHRSFWTSIAMAQVLDSFPNITSLGLSGGAARFASYKLTVRNASYFCPLLEELELDDSHITKTALLRLVKSRTTFDQLLPSTSTQERVPLRLLKLSECKAINRATVSALEEMGVKVEWDKST